MDIDYEVLLEASIEAVSKYKIWVLATSANNHVTARSMSIVNNGLSVFFQCHKDSMKFRQIEENFNVALCHENIQIEGRAVIRGNAFNGENEMFLELYRQEHPDSYGRYTSLEGQMIVEVVPQKITFWKYIDNTPYKDILDVVNTRATRMEQLHLPL